MRLSRRTDGAVLKQAERQAYDDFYGKRPDRMVRGVRIDSQGG